MQNITIGLNYISSITNINYIILLFLPLLYWILQIKLFGNVFNFVNNNFIYYLYIYLFLVLFLLILFSLQINISYISSGFYIILIILLIVNYFNFVLIKIIGNIPWSWPYDNLSNILLFIYYYIVLISKLKFNISLSIKYVTPVTFISFLFIVDV